MSIPYNVLLLPLLAGYLLASWFRYARFYTSRQSGQRLVFVSSLFGLGLLILSYVIIILLNEYVPSVGRLWHAHVPFAYAGHGALSLVLGVCFAIVGNFLSDESHALEWAMSRSSTDSMERMLYRAANTSTPVQITLNSGKVYIGHIARVPPISGSVGEYLEILPILSGYRENETHTVHYTFDYIDLIMSVTSAPQPSTGTDLSDQLASGDVSKFIKVLPIADVAIVSLFHERAALDQESDARDPQGLATVPE